jgi:hypothetical protein
MDGRSKPPADHASGTPGGRDAESTAGVLRSAVEGAERSEPVRRPLKRAPGRARREEGADFGRNSGRGSPSAADEASGACGPPPGRQTRRRAATRPGRGSCPRLHRSASGRCRNRRATGERAARRPGHCVPRPASRPGGGVPGLPLRGGERPAIWRGSRGGRCWRPRFARQTAPGERRPGRRRPGRSTLRGPIDADGLCSSRFSGRVGRDGNAPGRRREPARRNGSRAHLPTSPWRER